MDAFKGKRAVIMGRSGSIGGAIAERLAHEGADIWLLGRNKDKLLAAASRCMQHGGRVEFHSMDLGKDDEIGRGAEKILADAGTVDIFIHAAGTICIGNMANASIEDYDLQNRINVRAPLILTAALLPALKRQAGQVVFIISSAVLRSHAGIGHYVASKRALKGLADTLRLEVNADGVRVTCVYPGRTASELQERLHRLEKRAYNPEKLMQPDDVAVVVVNALLVPRTAEVTEIHIRPMMKCAHTHNDTF